MDVKSNAAVQRARNRMQPSGCAGSTVGEKPAPNKIPDVQTMAVLNGGLAVGAFPNPTAETAHDSPFFCQNRIVVKEETHRA